MNLSINQSAAQPTLLHILKRHTVLFVAGGLIGATIAVGIAFLLPKQWPATLLFQIGQIGSSGNLLVDPNNVIQRVKFPGFVIQVLQSQNLPIDESINERSAIVKKSLTANLAKGGNLVEMTVKGHSPEEAKANLAAAFQVLQVEHAQLLTPSITKLKKNLADATASLKKMDDERTAILDPIKKANSAGTIERKFSESILLVSMLKSNEAETRAFRDQITSLEEQLSPYRTFNTKAITSIFVPKNATFPKKSIAAVLGLFLGILIAGVWVFVRDKELRDAIGGTQNDAT